MSTLYAPAADLWSRVLERVVVDEHGCWIFKGATNSQGYGQVGSGRGNRSVLTHRLAVIVRDGSIPDGMTVDHQCHDAACDPRTCQHRRCVNPDHLAVMTIGDNVRRQHEGPTPRRRRPLTHCRRGHEFTPENVKVGSDGYRTCRTCYREKDREAHARKRART